MRDLLTDLPAISGRPESREMIIDCFAGGGGASTGIFQALGRHPDIAVNHDAEALAMHRANHPDTLHVSKNIYQVDPMDLCHNRPVGLLWASPDCKHFSKAKGGRPVKRNIRDLAWTVVTWAKRARPRVIILENVEEFLTWGPVVPDGAGGYKPCKDRAGETFKAWVRDLKRHGYKVEWRELRACDYGAPTIRKRLFVIARRDGKPIVWPEPTHGAPDDPAVVAGKKKPWRTAAEIIDWSLPCPSIFDTSAEIFEKFGVRAKRPLAEATLKRIARGVVRYVLEAQKPFLVVCNHGGDWFRGQGLDEPMPTLTASRDAFGLVAPVVSYAQQGGGNRPANAPLHTLTASAKDQNCLLVPSLVGCGGRAGQSAPRGGDMPVGTQTAKADGCLVSAFLAKHNTGATGAPLDGPAPTITANGISKRPGGAAPVGLVSAHMMSMRGSDRRDYAADQPARTDSAGGNHEAVAACYLDRQFTRSIGADLGDPCPTLTAGGDGKANVVAAFLHTYYGCSETHSLAEPMGTDTTLDRRSLVTVDIDGETFAVVDIGMRMLTPRERFRAQGFLDSYRIETGIGEDGGEISLSQSAQGRMCGNSVCPPVAMALAGANVPELAEREVAA
ncbi:DNA cytosine methyltransferase [Roseibium sediminicola]|uniref:DNA (cytosine-5-)-methyltransferase n=1 Tax=Roseibium sediminicola TaxID=2933272 RepID=A0ABT0H0I4_9HYPH|nr:DNA cytosine methyltransferase [Roseibium sp. CAU 1639]MCK7615199.1 DNA cytosine methyltransferase [Roseibium sp. CAU 1639]